MSVPTSTYETYSAVGIRDDLTDEIYNVDPTDTPLLTAFAKIKATQTLHEWQTDALDTPSTSNAVAEGDDATNDSITATVRLSNSCQISDKVIQISGTQEVVVKAGRKSEMGYQIAKAAKGLKNDMESTITRNGAEVAGSSGTARQLGAINAWLDTNTSAGVGGSDGSVGNTARTDGTPRVFTEDLLTANLQSIWENGGDPDMISVGAFNKRKMSAFTGNATRYVDAMKQELNAAIDIYVSDWGRHKIMPNRRQRSRDVLFIQTDMFALAYLRTFNISDLAKTGDSNRKQMLVEYTLESRNEKASGGVFDLTTS